MRKSAEGMKVSEDYIRIEPYYLLYVYPFIEYPDNIYFVSGSKKLFRHSPKR